MLEEWFLSWEMTELLISREPLGEEFQVKKLAAFQVEL
jgi:hypothetical protein